MDSEVTNSTVKTFRTENDQSYAEAVQTRTQTGYIDSPRESSETSPRPNHPSPDWQQRMIAKNMSRRASLKADTTSDNESNNTNILDVIYLSNSQAGRSASSVKDSQGSKYMLAAHKQGNKPDKTAESKKKCIDTLEKEWGKDFYKQLPAWPESPGKSFLQYLVMLANTEKIPFNDFREDITTIYHERIAEKPELKGYDRYIKIGDAKTFLGRYKDAQNRITSHKAPVIRSSSNQSATNQPDIRSPLVRKRTMTFLEPDIDHSDRNPRRQRLESIPLEASTPDNRGFQPGTTGSIASKTVANRRDVVNESREEQHISAMPSTVVESSMTSQSKESHLSTDPAEIDNCLRSSTRSMTTSNTGIPMDSPERDRVIKEFMSTDMLAPQDLPLETTASIQSKDVLSAEEPDYRPEPGVSGHIATSTRPTVATVIENETTTTVNDRALAYNNSQPPALTQQKYHNSILNQNTRSSEQALIESRNGIEGNISTTDRNLNTYRNITTALDKMSQPIDFFQEQIEVLKTGINHLQAQSETLNKENTCLVDERSQLKLAIENSATQNGHLQTENLELKAKNLELSRLVEGYTSERDNLATKVRELERMLQSIRSITLSVGLESGLTE